MTRGTAILADEVAPFSPIMRVAAFVLPIVTMGMTRRINHPQTGNAAHVQTWISG